MAVWEIGFAVSEVGARGRIAAVLLLDALARVGFTSFTETAPVGRRSKKQIFLLRGGMTILFCMDLSVRGGELHGGVRLVLGLFVVDVG